jgi:lipoprotein-releasing system permease protein
MYELLVGFRYIRSGRVSGFVNFISILATIGIALGVAALIIVLSVMNGFQKEVRDKMLCFISR